jgi:hypothetical protein
MAWNDENIAPSVTQETDAALVSLGQHGFDFVDGTSAQVGNYAAIQILSDATFDTVANGGLVTVISCTIGNLANASLTLSAGTIIYGPFKQFKLTTGKVIAYRA